MDALQLLKDTIFGMEASYTDFCYNKEAPGWYLDEDKVQSFIRELLKNAKCLHICTPDQEELISSFLHIVIEYLDRTFSSHEYKFSSIRKISAAVKKEFIYYKSPFDILIEDEQKNLSEECLAMHTNFTNKIVSVNQDDFVACVKYALEKFIDDHQLSCLSDEFAARQTASRIRRLADRIQLDQRHRSSRATEASDGNPD